MYWLNDYQLDLAAKKLRGGYKNGQLEKTLADVMKSIRMTENFDVGMEMSGSRQSFDESIT